MNIKKWKGYDHFKYIMDNICVGSEVVLSADFYNKTNYEIHKVTEIKDCDSQFDEHVDPICQLCVGGIGLDGDEPDCFHTDSMWDRTISTYIRKIIKFEEIEFITPDEMKI